jgi:DNA-binding MarR family transcriptional regulator
MMPEETNIRSIERAIIRIARSMGRRDLGRQVERSLGSRVDVSFLPVVGAVDELNGSAAPTIKDIARHLDVHHSRASRLVKDTIRSGLVIRLASQDDARKSCIALSDKGQKIAAAIHTARAKFFATRLKGWSKADRRKLAVLLARFAEKDTEGRRKNNAGRAAVSHAAAFVGNRKSRVKKNSKRASPA